MTNTVTGMGTMDSSSSSSDESDDLAPEIWSDDSDTDSEKETISPQHNRMIYYVLSYFLLFFQLCYHVSDRGLHHIFTLISLLVIKDSDRGWKRNLNTVISWFSKDYIFLEESIWSKI